MDNSFQSNNIIMQSFNTDIMIISHALPIIPYARTEDKENGVLAQFYQIWQ